MCFHSEKLKSVTRKLKLFESDISTCRLLHFSTRTPGQVTDLTLDFIKQLRANFTSRLEDYSVSKDITDFVWDPLAVRPSGKKPIPSLEETAFETELIDFQTTSTTSARLVWYRSTDLVFCFCFVKPDTACGLFQKFVGTQQNLLNFVQHFWE